MKRFKSLPIEIKLNENAIREALTKSDQTRIEYEVQLLRTGLFYHPAFGEMDITKSMLESMVKNFEDEVRGVDLAIDYSHDSHDIAAGWVQGLTLREENGRTELWAIVEWTPKGVKRLADKEFRYLSADFTLDYQDNETLKTFGPTLLGAGLTNRPFVKNMQPAVTLTEGEKGQNMSVDELKKQVSDLQDKNQALSDELAELKKVDYEAQLAEKDKAIEKKDEQIKELVSAKELSEKEKAFDKLLAEGKAVPAQKDAYLKGDMVKFAELFVPVNSKESGNDSKDGAKDEDYSAKVHKLAEEKQAKEKGLGFSQAVSMVLKENKDLSEKYMKEGA